MARLFIAINIPPDLRSEIHAAAETLRESVPDAIGWTPAEKLHLTLKFIGETEEAVIDPLIDLIGRVAARHSAPLVQLREIGAFPNLRRPRVVWLGVEPEPRLELIHHDIEEQCERLGYELEGRAYRPHLTLGRVRRFDDLGAFRALSRAAKKVTYKGEFIVHGIDLMRSDLGGSRGATYTTVATAALRTS